MGVSASTGKLPAGSACSGVHMALCAVNLAECAEEKIPPGALVEIHLTAAVGLKTRCGGKLGFLAVSATFPSATFPSAGASRQELRCRNSWGPCAGCWPREGHSPGAESSDQSGISVPRDKIDSV